MTAPPFLIEAAEPEDLDALSAIERRCYTHPWTARGFRDALGRPQGMVLVARAAGEAGTDRRILAYCVIDTVADELHVHNLAVVPEWRGRGLARRLMAVALRLGARRGAVIALLEVRESNHAAIGLYRSLRFVPVAQRRNYYSQPAEDALVLRRDGLPAPEDEP